MRTFDLSPLFRSSVGFDHLTRALDAAVQLNDSALTFPPYNIEKYGNDAYRIAMAVAGFSADELDVVTNEGQLIIRGKARNNDEQSAYLYHGIANRAFERRFQLADYIRVVGSRLENGMLYVDLVRRLPEALKPRRIEIATGPAPGATPALSGTQPTEKAAA